ncbi:uncharacterized protein LY89DRAFT_695732 [Mollisia scopiformis]|uniref:Zn(2)-C6 fungal-type domain-containing protein n=1 Tax=Mollisia scopiformis TaxID=149040 RepID=A0A194XJC2_MOLSC|nr:uncharacterized protein LY89DRAFT_695732 [Mollisia scopiformis]KUJ20226.1 hypothetical protein LY89DRAFT_695732 [Mollisia scopiformis]
MASKIILVTGANTGLGFETIKSLCQSSKSYTILLGGRSLEKANAAVKAAQTEFPGSPSVIEAVQIDIEDDDSIDRLFNQVLLQHGRIDILINNAGALLDQQFYQGKMTMREMWNKSWAVNTTSTHVVTHTLMPLLLKSSDPRLIFITSGTSTLAESGNTLLGVNHSPSKGWPKPPNGVPAYRSTKTGMNMMMREWVRILKDDGVKIWCISPGYLATGLGGSQEVNKQMGAIDPRIGANFVRDVVEGTRDQDVGKVIRKDNQCRARKVRCDRGHPCRNCLRRDEAQFCNYESSSIGRHAAEDRLSHLEATVKQLMRSQTLRSPPVGLDVPDPENSTASTQALLDLPPDSSIDQPRGADADNNRYVGSTHWSDILNDIHGLKEILARSGEVQDSGESIAFEPAYSGDELIFGTSRHYNVQHIISQMLPPKVEVDRFLALYFRGETFIIPFVHTFYFQRQYNAFWADMGNVNPLWLSMLFSICCLASLVGEHHSSQDELITRRSILHAAAGQCLVAGEYYHPQPFAVEALAMYGHCKNLRTLDPSREAGAILAIVVRMAYEMGYHRDPDLFGNFSVFEGEMRRRFWAAIKQMDLMSSFQLGLPTNISPEQSDTKSPRNLLDTDFDENTRVLPASRSKNEVTRLLWFIVKDNQMHSFYKVCQHALSFKDKSEEEIRNLDEEIRRMHDMTPEVLRVRPLSESIVDPAYLVMTRIFVEFIYLKSLCALHRRYMARGNVFSTGACVEAGTTLVRQFIEVYSEFRPGGMLYMERWMLTNFTMNDFLMGVMVLCLVVHTRWRREAQEPMIDPAMEDEAKGLLERSFEICSEKSSVSRDALRVSHAIRLTLNGTNHWKDTTNTTVSHPSVLLVRSPGLTHRQVHGNVFGDEAAFGALDPFNFAGHDLESIDWSIFELSNSLPD